MILPPSITRNNELVALQRGKVLWKQRLSADSYTPPLVAGRRVFVQSADRSFSAWDGQTGKRLWAQQRTAENLVLKRPGVLIAVDDTLVAGIGGRLAGLHPGNGAPRWEVPIAAPRGTNDVERLVDLTGPASRIGDSVCARAYFASVGCVGCGARGAAVDQAGGRRGGYRRRPGRDLRRRVQWQHQRLAPQRWRAQPGVRTASSTAT